MHTLKINFKCKLSFEDSITESTPGTIEWILMQIQNQPDFQKIGQGVSEADDA